MAEPVPGTPPDAGPPEARLDSWKEIASYLKRDMTTVQRWEKREGMPVHRHVHDRKGSVYGFGSELDAWLQSRRLRLEKEEQEKDRNAETAPDEEGIDPIPRSFRTGRWLVSGVAVVLVLVAVGYVLTRNRAQDKTRPKIESLAVLPLKNLSGDPTQEYLAEGMTEALIGRLSRIHNLRVISHTSVMRFRDTQLSVPEIARMLRVDAVVEGSVIREGTRIRVSAQLIRGASDEHVWSDDYDRELQDVLALQSDVAQSIAHKVEVAVTGEERRSLAKSRSVSPEVYESYLKGRYALGRSNSREDVKKSMAYFEDAIQRDPTFAPAYAGMAAAYLGFSSAFIGGSPEEGQAKAVAAARKAVELDPELPRAHVLLGEVLIKQWHWAEAEAEYRRALEIDPGDGAAQNGWANWLLCQGRIEEALDWAKLYRERDPLIISSDHVGWILFQARRYDEAIRELRSVLALEPEDTTVLWHLGFALIANGQAESAIPVLEKSVSLSDRSPGGIGVLIRAYAHAGRQADALRLLDELKRRQRTGFIPAAAFVHAYLGLGDNEQAFVWLERGYQEQSGILQFLKVHPYFDPLRNDPRFTELVHRVGLDRTP